MAEKGRAMSVRGRGSGISGGGTSRARCSSKKGKGTGTGFGRGVGSKFTPAEAGAAPAHTSTYGPRPDEYHFN